MGIMSAGEFEHLIHPLVRVTFLEQCTNIKKLALRWKQINKFPMLFREIQSNKFESAIGTEQRKCRYRNCQCLFDFRTVRDVLFEEIEDRFAIPVIEKHGGHDF
jgi:hypothetical protein